MSWTNYTEPKQEQGPSKRELAVEGLLSILTGPKFSTARNVVSALESAPFRDHEYKEALEHLETIIRDNCNQANNIEYMLNQGPEMIEACKANIKNDQQSKYAIPASHKKDIPLPEATVAISALRTLQEMGPPSRAEAATKAPVTSPWDPWR